MSDDFTLEGEYAKVETGQIHQHAHLAVVVLLVPFFTLGIFTNILSIVFHSSKRRWKTVTGVMGLVLSFFIFLGIVSSIPLELSWELLIQHDQPNLIFNEHHYYIAAYVALMLYPVVGISMSIVRFLIAIISAVQYVEICHPTKAVVHCTYRKVLIFIGIAFLFSVFSNLHIIAIAYSTWMLEHVHLLPPWIHIVHMLFTTIVLTISPTVAVFILNRRIENEMQDMESRKFYLVLTPRRKITTNMLLGLTKWSTILATISETFSLVEIYIMHFVDPESNYLITMKDISDIAYFGFTMVPFIMFLKYSKTYFNFVKNVVKCRRGNANEPDVEANTDNNQENLELDNPVFRV